MSTREKDYDRTVQISRTKKITGKNITKNLELTSKEERYIFRPSDSDAEG